MRYWRKHAGRREEAHQLDVYGRITRLPTEH
jgi:hypothetical protein